MSFGSSGKLAQLEARLGSDWKAIRGAHEATQERRAELTAGFASRVAGHESGRLWLGRS